MSYLLIMLIIPLATTTLNFSPCEVIDASKEVLKAWKIPLKEELEYELTTEKMELDLKFINDYIIEDQPDDNPGWTKARFYLDIRISKIDIEKCELDIKASLERFGVPSAMLLIPPVWTAVPSNGTLEKEFFEEIKETLNTPKRREK